MHADLCVNLGEERISVFRFTEDEKLGKRLFLRRKNKVTSAVFCRDQMLQLKKLEGIANGTGGGIVLFCQSPQRGKPPVGKFSRGDTGAQSVIQLFFQSFVGHNLPPVF